MTFYYTDDDVQDRGISGFKVIGACEVRGSGDESPQWGPGEKHWSGRPEAEAFLSMKA